jgi:hypothetical protein
MPDLSDAVDVKAAIASLSPYEDGRPVDPGAGSVSDEPASNRALFKTWLFRYVANNEFKRDPRNLDPVPSTIGEAIASERAIHERNKIAQAEHNAEWAQRRAQAESETAARKQREAEEEARKAVEQAADRTRREAERLAGIAQLEQQVRDTAAMRERREPAYDCRMKRQEAASAALKDPKAVETRAYQRVWDSFACSAN